MKNMLVGILVFASSFATTVAQESDFPAVGVYDKPSIVLLGGRAAIGGFFETMYLRDSESSTFAQQTLNPFIHTRIDDDIFFAVGMVFGNNDLEEDDETFGFEYAALDLIFTDMLALRSGLIKSPIGRFNLEGDGPVNDLTMAPLMFRDIIPATLTEAGIGFFGNVFVAAEAMLEYEFYMVNGFDASILTLKPDSIWDVRLNDASFATVTPDNNDNKAFTGRLMLSPKVGINIGTSFHRGDYDRMSSKRLFISAVDFSVSSRDFELIAEMAWADISLPGEPGSYKHQSGYFLQANLHLFEGIIQKWSLSKFTAVLRYDSVDYDTKLSGDAVQRITIGGNFRPVESTVFKLDYLLDSTKPFGTNEQTDSGSSFVFSVASYF